VAGRRSAPLTKDAVKVSPATNRVTSTDESVRAFKEDVTGDRRKAEARHLWTCARLTNHRKNYRASRHDGNRAARRPHSQRRQHPWAEAANEDGTFNPPTCLQLCTRARA